MTDNMHMSNEDQEGPEKPLSDWRSGWLKLEVANLLRNPRYLIMTQDEKLDRDFPVSDEEMRAFIEAKRREVE